MAILMGVFLILHGLVHLLYAGQSWRLFELRPGMLWPGGSWLFSTLPGDGVTRYLATGSLVLAALGLFAAGLALILRHDAWRPTAVGAAVFSIVIFGLLWNGKFQALDEQCGVGVLIDLAILGTVLLLRWPA